MLTREILILPIMTGCIIVRGIRCIIARGGDFVLQRSQLQMEPAPAPGRGSKYSSARVQYKHKQKHITSGKKSSNILLLVWKTSIWNTIIIFEPVDLCGLEAIREVVILVSRRWGEGQTLLYLWSQTIKQLNPGRSFSGKLCIAGSILRKFFISFGPVRICTWEF